MNRGTASPDITRERLLARLKAARPRLIAPIAPAGYGKSTVIRQYAATLQTQTTCDCMPVRTIGDLARGVAAALASNDQEIAVAVSQQQLAGADEQTWSDFAVELWSRANTHELFIFENSEHIADRLELVEFLGRLLARTPPWRRIAICTRRALPLSLSRYVAPHELVTLRSEDLRFDAQEIEAAFSGVEMPAHGVSRVMDLTHGWPMAVLLLARLARERSVSALFERLGGIAFEDLYDYLAEQVLDTMPAERFLRLVAVAAIPRATAAEVAAALNDPDALVDLPLLAKTSPFLYAVSPTVYEAHPLVRAMLRERHAQLCERTVRSAADALRSADPLRSAQLYAELGDEESAASQLEDASKLFITDTPALFAEITARLSAATLIRHPGVWSAATPVRATAIPHRQWLHEALVARDNLAPDAPASTKMGVLTSLGNVLTNLGRHEEALEVFRAFDLPEMPEPIRFVARLSEAAVEARRGHFTRAMEIWEGIQSAFSEVKFARAIILEEVHTRAARYNGNRNAERMVLETAIALAHESATALAVALTLEEAAFSAWLAGEDSLFSRYAGELEAAVAPNTARGTEVFRACARGDYTALARSQGVEHPKIHFYASLIACGNAPRAQREAFAERALKAAADAGEPMSEVLALVACAETGARDRAECIEKARLAAASVDAQALHEAVEAYAAGASHCGLLAPLVQRLRADSHASSEKRHSHLRVSILECTVERNGNALKLSNRELELFMYLATQNRACGSEEILEALWPNRAETDDTVLRVYVTRVRAKLGSDAIVSTAKGYRLDSAIDFDLVQIERSLQQARREKLLGSDLRKTLEEHLAQLSGSYSPRLLRWQWSAAVQLRISELRQETALLLGRDALANDEIERAVQLAKHLIERDACDEPARELLIRSYLASGDRAAALREFRIYRTMLAEELGAEPSEALENLFSDINLPA